MAAGEAGRWVRCGGACASALWPGEKLGDCTGIICLKSNKEEADLAFGEIGKSLKGCIEEAAVKKFGLRLAV